MATKSYVVISPILSDRRYNVGDTIELTDEQAKRPLARGDVVEPDDERAAAALEAASVAQSSHDLAAASDHVPFTGNTAGQPVADSAIGFAPQGGSASVPMEPLDEESKTKGRGRSRAKAETSSDSTSSGDE
jgi:hypothetical protein